MKLIEAASEDKPRQCRANIASDTAALEWKLRSLNGGYKVQPVPKDSSLLILSSIKL